MTTADRDFFKSLVQPALASLIAQSQPMEGEEIKQALRTLAEALQVSLPEEDGVLVYVAVLQKTSRLALRHGLLDLVSTHEWPRMPLPVEILKAAATLDAELLFWRKQLENAMRLIHKAEREQSRDVQP